MSHQKTILSKKNALRKKTLFPRKTGYLASTLALSLSLLTFQQSMAITQEPGPVYPAKQTRAPQAAAVQYPAEIVVKFKPQVTPPQATSANSTASKAVNAIAGLEFNPLFKTLPKPVPSAAAKAADNRVFDRYYTVSVPAGAKADELILQLKNSGLVDEAYLKPQPVEAPALPAANTTPVVSGDDTYFSQQGYAQPAPQGTNAVYAWEFEGGDGKGVKWVDVEQGWAFGHEDLAAHNVQLLPGGLSAWYHSHGTAVLGEISAVDNALGNLGLASKAKPYAASQHRVGGTYNTAEAILEAASVLAAGDVILLEAQAGYPTASGYVPVEVYPAEFDAIQYVTSLGITVVEAAGNGSVDLDSFQTTDGKYTLNPNSPDFKDSGAIIVGAASYSVPRYRLGFSTYGNRIDTHGWGENVATLDAADGNSTTGYMSYFSGTSSASPIVTGAAISIQGIAKAKFGTPYSPAELRRLLKSAQYNTPTSDAAYHKIGHMPNLREIINHHLVTPGTVPVDTTAPSAPTGLAATQIQTVYATITWNQATDNTSLFGYDVFVNGSAQPVASTSNTTVSLWGLNPATQYTITIKTRDGAHNLSAASAPLVITTLPESQCAGNAWNAATAYTTGQKASYGGTLYEAKWWTQNQRPDLNSGQWGVWKVVGPC